MLATILVLYIHVFCDFWADQVHVLWFNTQFPAQRTSQPTPAPHPQQVQPPRKAVRIPAPAPQMRVLATRAG